MKSDSEIGRRLDAEFAACETDPTLKKNQFVQGYITGLTASKGRQKDFIEGLIEALEFVQNQEKW